MLRLAFAAALAIGLAPERDPHIGYPAHDAGHVGAAVGRGNATLGKGEPVISIDVITGAISAERAVAYLSLR